MVITEWASRNLAHGWSVMKFYAEVGLWKD